MPAAAVIPAPIAYIKVAAVKKLVVGFLVRCPWVAVSLLGCRVFRGFAPTILSGKASCPLLGRGALTCRIIYCEKIRVFKAGFTAFEYISME